MKKIITLLILTFISATTFAQLDSVKDDSSYSSGIDSVKNNRLLIYPGFGVSLVRNEIAPLFFINIGIKHRDRYEINMNTSSFFFFERSPDKNYKIYRNTFLNAEFLLNFSPLGINVKNWNGFGAGYLIETNGQYFRDATVQIYYKRKYRFLSIMPGFMLADNFKDVFPVITIRL